MAVPLANSRLWDDYPHGHLDEVLDRRGNVRPVYAKFVQAMKTVGTEGLASREQLVQQLYYSLGITFGLGTGDHGIERPIPFDIIPRIISERHWRTISRGMVQRILALNALVADIYGSQRIIRAGVIPAEMIYSSPMLKPRMMGVTMPKNVWIAIAGCDVVRTGEDSYAVLEDNVRTPSGVSYVLENRLVSSRIWPHVIRQHAVEPVAQYPHELLRTFLEIRPGRWVLLTPGVYNSAYFEHSLLANLMGIELVEARDLLVLNNQIHVKTTSGLQPVDGIYRRLDEDFLDPLTFRPDSQIGVQGLGNLLPHGNLGLANAIGTGVVDDKAMYRFVPDAIRYYLGEEPILDSIPTYLPSIPKEREYVFANWKDMVIKPVGESGGKGVLFGSQMTDYEVAYWQGEVERNPRNYVCQPVVAFSQAPCFVDGRLEPRFVDFRPFCLLGDEPRVLTGGLTRVALNKRSRVVNSSQGGGTKDTWVERRATDVK